MTCPCCGAPGVALGVLGSLLWWRCRGCGMDFNTTRRSGGALAPQDIEVKGQGSAFLLIPKTRRARCWLQSWATTVVTSDRVDDVVAEARVAGLAVKA